MEIKYVVILMGSGRVLEVSEQNAQSELGIHWQEGHSAQSGSSRVDDTVIGRPNQTIGMVPSAITVALSLAMFIRVLNPLMMFRITFQGFFAKIIAPRSLKG